MTEHHKLTPRLHPVLPLLLTLLLAACGGGTSTRPVAPEVAQTAETAFREGEFETAAKGFIQAAGVRRKQANYYRLRAAEAWRENGDMDKARSVVSNAGHKGLTGDQPLRLNLLLAEIDLADDKPQSAQDWLRQPIDSVGDAYLNRFLDLRARAFAVSNPIMAAAARAQLDGRLRPVDRVENLTAIDQLLAGLSDQRLQRAAIELPAGDPLYPFAGRELSRRGLPLPRPLQGGIVLNSALPPAAADGWRPPFQVALLLPAQGSIAAAANAVRDGFFAAGYAESRRRPAVRVYDAGSNPQDSVSAYRQAVADGAGLVVGPLSRESVAALFAEGATSVPLLALNRGGDLPPPPGSLSFALSPEDDARAAAERLWVSGQHYVMAIGSDDEGGRRSLAAFREMFERRGGTIAAEVVLPSNSPRYDKLLRTAVQEAGGVTIDPETGIPEVNRLDALFFAVRASEARLLVPQLKVQGIQSLPTVATSSILVGSDARLDRELDDILVADSPWLLSDVPGTPRHTAMASELASASGVGSRLFAFGMDAYRLVGYLEWLSQRPDATLEGATGQLSLDGFGNVRRVPGWALLRDGQIRPAPATSGIE